MQLKEKKVNLKKGIAYVFFANALNLIISLFTGFVLPKYLSIDTYADIKLFQLYITYVGIMHLGFSDGMYLRNGGKSLEKVNKESILSEFRTFKIFQIAISIIAILISICIKNRLLLYCSLVILPINIGSYLKSLYQAIGEFKRYSRFTNINTILIFIINIILLVIIKSDNSKIYIVMYILAYFFYWLIIELANKKMFQTKEKIKGNKKYLIKDIKSGFFLMIGNFCNIIFTSIDRLFVKYLIGTIEFAYYSFAVSIENLMNVFITPISTVMYNYLCNNREKKRVVETKGIILVFSTIVVAVMFPAKFVIQHWIQKYNSALNVLFLLFAAQYISIMIRCIHVNLYKAEKKQNRYFIFMIVIVILSVILNTIGYIIKHSIEIIAIATVITNIIWFIMGELDFKKYKLKLSYYIYTFLILGLFLLCGKIDNAIIGFLIYISVAFILMIICIPKTVKICLVNFNKEIKKILKRFNNC